jgi:rare lipoprotein A
VNDRGPYIEGRIIDLSKRLAKELGMIERGVANVRIRATQPKRS